MKVVKASLAVPGDTGRIIYVSLEEAILLKMVLRKIAGDGETSVRKFAKQMVGSLSHSGVWVNGPDVLVGTLTCVPNSLAGLEDNVHVNNQ